MNSERARRVVLGTFFLVLLLIVADELYVAKRTPVPQRFVAATVVWIVLSIVAEAAPPIAAGFALLTTIGFAVREGGPIVDAVSGNKGKAKRRGPAKVSGGSAVIRGVK